MKIPGVILGFHGCDRKVADGIVHGGAEVRLSENAHDWLGTGAYFWENNPGRALSWAEFLKSKPSKGKSQICHPAVVGAIIDPGNCLDLTEESSLALVKSAYDGYVQFCKKAKLPIPTNEPGHPGDEDFVKRQLDCAVFNFLHQMRDDLGVEPFDTIRGPFLEGKPLFTGSGLSAKAHVQWCVRDPRKSVIGYFHPRDAHASTI